MADKQYLDKTGLARLWELVKQYVTKSLPTEATPSKAGLMSPMDKHRLDGVAWISDTSGYFVIPDTTGNGFSGDSDGVRLSIAIRGMYSNRSMQFICKPVTTTSCGVMSPSDKTNLDALVVFQSTATTDISALKTFKTTAEADIATLKEQVKALQDELKALKEQVGGVSETRFTPVEAWYKTTSPNCYYASNGVSVIKNAHIEPLYSNSVFTVINGVPNQSLTKFTASITSRVKALEDKAGITASDPTEADSDTHDATE